MKKSGAGLIKLAAVAVAGLVLAQSASSATIFRFDGYYSGNGGEFSVFGTGYELSYDPAATYNNGTPHGGYGVGFQTFCLELNEPSDTFPSEYTVDPDAYQGGKAGGSPDPLSVGSAWLYDQFADGALAGYEYTAGDDREASAAELQEAFWWLEDELGAGYDIGGNSFIALAYLGLNAVALDDLKADAQPGEYGVAVMNFTKYNELGEIEHRQSMLVRVPDGGLTLVMLGMGVLGSMMLRRRFMA